jgi:hypothetical protein
MKRFACALAAVALSLLSATAFSKSVTVKLEIVGPGLTEPLEISDRAVLDRFSIWGSPGIDWSRGVVPPPEGVKLYTVTFHQAGREPMHDWHRRYVVMYAVDARTLSGYVYLPGPKDGEVYERNVFSIVRDVEGNWFHASPAWERSVRSLLERAIYAAR